MTRRAMFVATAVAACLMAMQADTEAGHRRCGRGHRGHGHGCYSQCGYSSYGHGHCGYSSCGSCYSDCGSCGASYGGCGGGACGSYGACGAGCASYAPSATCCGASISTCGYSSCGSCGSACGSYGACGACGGATVVPAGGQPIGPGPGAVEDAPPPPADLPEEGAPTA